MGDIYYILCLIEYTISFFQIKELTEQLASAQSQMERALRDKVASLNDLEQAKLQIKRYDQEVSLVSIQCYIYSVEQKISSILRVKEPPIFFEEQGHITVLLF